MPDVLLKTRWETTMAVVGDLAPPAWVERLLDRTPARLIGGIEVRHGPRFSLYSGRVRGAVELSPIEFEQRTFELYLALAAALSGARHARPVRFWNHVPCITDSAGDGRDNYMVFNAGRYRAFGKWLGGSSRFERDVATATGVGHAGRDLVIHCLSASSPGRPVINPRQVAPYHYSQRFGPLPPCFARAMRIDQPRGMLLVGGTASVRGEDSVHIDDLAAQCAETFVNLASLVASAMERKLSARLRPQRYLETFRELRVYHPNLCDRAMIAQLIGGAFSQIRHIEWLHADLCRAELRVEIEGIADLSSLESK